MTQELRATSETRTRIIAAWAICAAVMVLLAFLLPKAWWLFGLLAIASVIIGWRFTQMRIELRDSDLVLRNLFTQDVIPRDQVVEIRDGQFLNWKADGEQHERLVLYLMGSMETGSRNPEGRAKQEATDAVAAWRKRATDEASR